MLSPFDADLCCRTGVLSLPLPLRYDTSVSLTDKIPFGAKSNIHPSIIQLGLRYSEGHVNGSTARCIAMLHAFKEVITDFVTPPGKDMSRVFTTMGTVACPVTFAYDFPSTLS